jgi:NRPS condensation-like uncharacterized protein
MKETSLRTYKTETWDLMQLLFARFNDHQARFAVSFDGHMDIVRLRRAVDLAIDAFPLARCRLVTGSGRPFWRDGGFTAEDMVFVVETDETEQEIQKALCRRIDELTDPQLYIEIVRSSKADWLCVVINHMLCDGADFKELLALLSSIYSNLAADPAYVPQYRMGSRSTGQVMRVFNWKSRLEILLKHYGLSRHDNSVVLGLEGDLAAPFIVTRTLPASRFRAMKAYAGQRGASINDLILAAYLRAMRQTVGKTAAIQCVVDLRKFLPDKKTGGFCNFISNLACDIGKDVGPGLDDTLAKVKSAMDAEKEDKSSLHLIMELDGLFGALPYRLARYLVLGHYFNPPFAMSNIGILGDEQLAFGGVQATGAFMTGSIKRKPYFLLSLSTFRDEVTLSSCFFGTPADKEKIEKFLEGIDRELPQ